MSLFISEMGGTKGRDGVQGQLYLITGLLRTVVDQVTDDLSDTRTRYIGSRPVKLFRGELHNLFLLLVDCIILR